MLTITYDVCSALFAQALPLVDDNDDDFVTSTKSNRDVARCPFFALMSTCPCRFHPCLIRICVSMSLRLIRLAYSLVLTKEAELYNILSLSFSHGM